MEIFEIYRVLRFAKREKVDFRVKSLEAVLLLLVIILYCEVVSGQSINMQRRGKGKASAAQEFLSAVCNF